MSHLFLSSVVVAVVVCTRVLSAESVCDSPVYCTGEILHTLQLAQIFPDSKTFVDLQLLAPEGDILSCFNRLMIETVDRPNRTQLMDFLDEHFEDRQELRYWHPPDYQPFPPILTAFSNLNVLVFTKDIISTWPTLGRQVVEDVAWNPEQYSLLYVPNGFIIPGGRFKELYYWDSYWIIKGLLISNMMKTAKGMIENLLYLVDKFGHIPNGSRVYYLGRSQPPLLTWMVYDYFEATGDESWLRKNIAIVEKELRYWIKTKIIVFKINGVQYKLLRYKSDIKRPRPEAYYEDYTNSLMMSDIPREIFYSEIRSAAESGWDFSSRWLKVSETDTMNVTEICTSQILPVDLNSIFAGALNKMGNLKDKLGNRTSARKYWSLAKQWRYTIDKLMWNDEDGVWYDFDTETMSQRRMFYLSCAAPLWADAVESWYATDRAKRFVQYLRSMDVLKFRGGVPTSLIKTGEQWDYPNAWPPLQSMLIGGLDKSNSSEAKRIAKKLAKTWVRANYKEYQKTQKFYEKYNCLYAGKHGEGGEYEVQNGFGWSNGVLLELIQRYGDELDLQSVI